MIKEAIGKLIVKEDLSGTEMEEVMIEILSKRASLDQIASFITALRMKGETVEEITSAAKVFRERISQFNGGEGIICLDREEITIERETILQTINPLSKGTHIFNISTVTAFVAAGGELKVAKTVRRSFPPFCGCKDVVEALGINLDMTRTQLERSLREIGLCFIDEHLIQNEWDSIFSLRRRIGIRTIFNLLDPLLNPTKAEFQILGVYEPKLTEKMARVLRSLGIQRGLVIYGEDTLDEMSLTGKTIVTEILKEGMRSYSIEPENLGMKRRKVEEIRGGTTQENAKIILEILKGERGAKRDITVLNAAGAFLISGRARDFQEGIEMAKQSIDSGAALKKFETIIKFNQAERPYLRVLP
ncbi:MAG: anthranilate phosphoribosyltransferase [Thermodesulfobacteriota bacterium]